MHGFPRRVRHVPDQAKWQHVQKNARWSWMLLLDLRINGYLWLRYTNLIHASTPCQFDFDQSFHFLRRLLLSSLNHGFAIATQSHSDETEDAVLSESDFEQFTEDGSQDMSCVLHFWYGRRLLQDYLASEIAKTTTIASPVGSLDVSHADTYFVGDVLTQHLKWHLSQRTARFPSDVLRKLQRAEPQSNYLWLRHSNDAAFHDCLALLGAVALRKLNPPQGSWQFLNENVAGVSTVPYREHLLHRGGNTKPSPEGDGQADPSLEEDTDLPRYTMVLKEAGDMKGQEPQYHYSQTSLYPPKFEVVLRYGATSYREKATPKKKAKRLASRQACNGLGITL